MVALDEDLQHLRPSLEAEGFRVVNLHEADLSTATAVIVSGMDDDLLGDTTRLTEAPVLNAEGRDAQELLQEVRQRARLQE